MDTDKYRSTLKQHSELRGKTGLLFHAPSFKCAVCGNHFQATDLVQCTQCNWALVCSQECLDAHRRECRREMATFDKDKAHWVAGLRFLHLTHTLTIECGVEGCSRIVVNESAMLEITESFVDDEEYGLCFFIQMRIVCGKDDAHRRDAGRKGYVLSILFSPSANVLVEYLNASLVLPHI